MTTRLLAAGLLCLLISTCAFAQTHVTYDHNVDFANYHTYMWQASPNPGKGEWNQRIIDAINKQLQAKGLRQVDSNPDLWVVYSNSIQNQTDVVGIGYEFGGLPQDPGGPATHATFINKVGTLVVDLADTKTKQLVWRGSSSNTISDNTNKNINNLDKAVGKLFKGFPPKEKK